jgi:hypothetical protein
MTRRAIELSPREARREAERHGFVVLPGLTEGEREVLGRLAAAMAKVHGTPDLVTPEAILPTCAVVSGRAVLELAEDQGEVRALAAKLRAGIGE